MNHHEIVEQLSSINIRSHHVENRSDQLKILVSILAELGIEVEMTSESSLKHVNPHPGDDDLFFAMNEIVRRRFPVFTERDSK